MAIHQRLHIIYAGKQEMFRQTHGLVGIKHNPKGQASTIEIVIPSTTAGKLINQMRSENPALMKVSNMQITWMEED